MCPGAAHLRLCLACALLVLSCGLARAGSPCVAPGEVRLVPAAGAAGGAAELCLDTGGAGPSRLRLARCDPLRVTQWWKGTPQQQLAQAETRKCVAVTREDGTTATTRACAASTRHNKGMRSVIDHDARGRLVLSGDGGCLSPAAETSEAAVLASPCGEASARWELPACADPPPLLSNLRNIALHKPAVMSSNFGGQGGDGAGAVDGWPEDHGCEASTSLGTLCVLLN